MYVAMTRARKTLTILAPEARPSEFVEELLKDPAYEAVLLPGSSTETCACGTCGGRLITAPTSTGNLRFRCEHTVLCGNDLPACPACKSALPHRKDETAICPGCGFSAPQCPDCADGWLASRQGPYGEFIGCIRYPACKGKGSRRETTGFHPSQKRQDGRPHRRSRS